MLKKIWPAYFLAWVTGYGYVQIIPGWGEFKRSSVNGITVRSRYKRQLIQFKMIQKWPTWSGMEDSRPIFSYKRFSYNENALYSGSVQFQESKTSSVRVYTRIKYARIRLGKTTLEDPWFQCLWVELRHVGERYLRNGNSLTAVNRPMEEQMQVTSRPMKALFEVEWYSPPCWRHPP